MTKLTRVVPAILTSDPVALESMLRETETFTSYVQLDIMDGQFVPSSSITLEHLTSLTMRLSWEAHLMVLHPEAYLQGFRQAGAQKIIFHYEATPSPREVISMARGLGLEVLLSINRIEVGRGFEAGLSIVLLAIIIDRITSALAARQQYTMNT